MNLRLTLSYDGTGFHGWAAQPGLRTVQGVLQEALDGAYPGWSGLHVAGRTDTGVHALAQVATVHVQDGPPPGAAPRALNGLLPPDVVVTDAGAAPDGFHARHSARARGYLYRVLTGPVPSALDARRVLFQPRPLDLDVLHAAAGVVVGRHDFTAFTPTETQHDDFERTVHEAAWTRVGEELHFTIAAESFLRHQVRTLVGTMLQAARGERDPDSLARLLAGAPRTQAGPTAAPWALYLAGVRFAGGAIGDEFVGMARSGRHTRSVSFAADGPPRTSQR